MNKQKKLVFMVEDDHDDRFITSNTLTEIGHDVPIKFFSNGEELFSALGHQIPSIILLDYNSTPDTGVQILRRLKSNDNYKSIPVVILTESSVPHFNTECYGNGAVSVIKKPDTTEMTAVKIKTFFDYWINVAETN